MEEKRFRGKRCQPGGASQVKGAQVQVFGKLHLEPREELRAASSGVRLLRPPSGSGTTLEEVRLRGRGGEEGGK